MNGKTLKITSLNISRNNPLGKRALSLIHKKRKPDIICLQEVPMRRIDHVKKLGYTVGQAIDYQHAKKSGYIATGLKEKNALISIDRARYYDEPIHAPLRLFYTKIAKVREVHESLVTTFRCQGKVLRVVNMHLSIACRPEVRIAQLTKILSRYADERTIFCGDLNVVADPLFKFFGGWLFGYKLSDYFFDERRKVNELIKSFNLQNPFAKRNTSIFPLYTQFDHILVPENMKIVRKKLFKVAFSDHKGLQLDIGI